MPGIPDASPPADPLAALDGAAATSRPADPLAVLASRDVSLGQGGFDIDRMLGCYQAQLHRVTKAWPVTACARPGRSAGCCGTCPGSGSCWPPRPGSWIGATDRTPRWRRWRAAARRLPSLLTLSQIRIGRHRGPSPAAGCWPGAAVTELAGVLERLGAPGGKLAWPLGSGWAWASPMPSAAGHAGVLVVAAAAPPPVEERFVLQALAQQTGVALGNAQRQAAARAARQDADQANRAKRGCVRHEP